MKARVLGRFQDRYNSAIVYEEGEIAEFSESRIAELLPLGLIYVIEEEKQEVKEAPKKGKK